MTISLLLIIYPARSPHQPSLITVPTCVCASSSLLLQIAITTATCSNAQETATRELVIRGRSKIYRDWDPGAGSVGHGWNELGGGHGGRG